MCGIIGYAPLDGQAHAAAPQAFARLFAESGVRGLHAFGWGAWREGRVTVTRAFEMDVITRCFDPTVRQIAHTRYSTSGDWHTLGNNQPVEASGIALAFNGVIHMGTKAEFEAAFDVQCATDNDGEVFLRRIEQGADPGTFVTSITGSFAGTWLREGRLYALRNARRPLWQVAAFGAQWVASTHDILRRAGFPHQTATELEPGMVYVL